MAKRKLVREIPDIHDYLDGRDVFYMDGIKKVLDNQEHVGNGAIPGDVIYVNRFPKPYKHFGVYLGRNRVIHFAPKAGGKSFSGDEDATIHEADMAEFMDGQSEYTVCIFGQEYGEEIEQEKSWAPSFSSLIGIPEGRIVFSIIRKFLRSSDYHLYSPKETIERARSRIGQHDYNLAFNNCEHFAVWCKTGISESRQIDHLLEIVLGCSIPFCP